MGGTSKSEQQQQTISQPWQPAQGGLLDIIKQLQGATGNTQLNPSEMSAFNTLLTNAQAGNPYGADINSYVRSALGGGGAYDQAGNLTNNLDAFKATVNPWVSNIGDPSQNPALRAMLDTIRTDTTNSINSQFAGAGRDLSGLNQQAVARGIAQGEAPVLLQAQQQGLNQAGNLYNAGNTTAGILSQLRQQYLGNQGTGLANSQAGLDALNYAPQQTLNLQSMIRGLPIANLAQIAQLLVPIAGLGGQTNSTASGSQTMSGAQQFGLIAGGLGNLAKLFPSDRRLKSEIAEIGKLANGLPIYRFTMFGEPHVGLMADEVETIHPEAIKRTLLFDMVDYGCAVL